VWGPVNQQSRLNNDYTASTNDLACFPTLPHIKKTFPFYLHRVLSLADSDVIITCSFYISVSPTCCEKIFNYF
jgi:hypothetical protein